jgi:hypothetical protein
MENPTKFVCQIRRTKEWAERYESPPDIFTEKWKVADIIRLWNITFTTNYIEFRRKLHQLQLGNLKDVGFDQVISSYEFCNDPGRYYPTDDDDWFDPHVLEATRGVADNIIYWDFLSFDRGRIYSLNTSNRRIQFETNNYCLDAPCEPLWLKHHSRASQALRGQGTHVEGLLSLRNRSLASLSLLRSIVNDEQSQQAALLGLFEVFRRPLTVEVQMPAYFDKFVDSMAELYKDLDIKKMLF